MTLHRIALLASLLASAAFIAMPLDADAKSAKAAPKSGAKSAAKTATASKSKPAAGKPKIPLPPSRPVMQARGTPAAPIALPKSKPANVYAAAMSHAPLATSTVFAPSPLASAPTSATSAQDLGMVKRALEFVRRGKIDDATELERAVSDPVAAKIIEWAILRSDTDGGKSYARFSAFVRANPDWPNVRMLTRRAEGALWDDKIDNATVLAFFAHSKPSTAKGSFALAKALLAQGDRRRAEALVRESWRTDPFTSDLEAAVLQTFEGFITRADYKARMDHHLYGKDPDIGLRMAKKLGPTELALAKARLALRHKAKNSKALLDAVPASARHDAGYIHAMIQWLRREDRIAEAGALMLRAPRDPAVIHDTDEWWIERRLVARKLLDIGDPKTAYRVVRDAAVPERENYRAEHQFTAGWIALRFLNDPATALHHFARIGEGIDNPIARARGEYWQGRALEAMGRRDQARHHYQAAAHYPTAYYGQIARARLGHGELGLRPTPQPDPMQRASLAKLEIVRAVAILYAIDERDLAVTALADLGDRLRDIGALVTLAELASSNNDSRGLLHLAKGALSHGMPMDAYAFPIKGIPRYDAIGPAVEPAIVYSIVRQESAFNPRIVSSAKALGLMQVTPDAGRYIAKKFGAKYDQHRLLHDLTYNVQFGAAELGDVIQDYRGSYILAFAAYNAGRGRVREWVGRYGDPRDPDVDPIDWVERIPFSETRNYVQRVLENVQVYRQRFGGGSRLMIEADLKRGAVAN